MQPHSSAGQPASSGPSLPATIGETPSHAILHGPSFAMLRLDLAPGQRVVAEAGAMVARHQQIGMEVKLNANPRAGLLGTLWSLLIALIRRLVGGETFFVNHFVGEQAGSVWLAPTMSGQIAHRRLKPNERLTLSSGAYLASCGDVDVDMKFGGLTSIFAKEGAFMLDVHGDGDLWFTSYGGITEIEVDGSYIVDTGHLVGYEGDLTMSIRSAGGGILGLMGSGEGLVCEMKGRGKVYVQSRSMGSLVDWLIPMLPS